MPTAMVPMPVLCQDGTRPANMDVCTIAARLRSKTEATEGVRTPQRPSDLLVVGPWPGAVAEVARELRAEAEAALKGEAARRLEVEEAAGLDRRSSPHGGPGGSRPHRGVVPAVKAQSDHASLLLSMHMEWFDFNRRSKDDQASVIDPRCRPEFQQAAPDAVFSISLTHFLKSSLTAWFGSSPSQALRYSPSFLEK